MNIDYPIALMVFIIILAWAFSFYFTLFKEKASVMETISKDISDRVVDFLTNVVYIVPTEFDTENATSNVIMYMDYFFPFGTNTTRVFRDETPIDCMVSNHTVYWEDDLNAGNNYYTVRYSDLNTSMNCTADLNVSLANQTFPWAAEKEKRISKVKMNNMTSIGYAAFRDSLKVSRDFRLTLNYSGRVVAFGSALPLNTTRYSHERWGRIEESGEKINITVFTW